MLGPLAELAPHLLHPVQSRRIGDLWDGFDQGMHPLLPVALDLNLA
jgi:2-amino-4-hydroxy-6-hydroxymethyldihydropteridine diphosphokinase